VANTEATDFWRIGSKLVLTLLIHSRWRSTTSCNPGLAADGRIHEIHRGEFRLRSERRAGKIRWKRIPSIWPYTAIRIFRWPSWSWVGCSIQL